MKSDLHHLAAVALCLATVVGLREAGLPPGTETFHAVVFGVGLIGALLAEGWERKRSGITTKFNISRPRMGRFALYLLVWLAIAAWVVYVGLPFPTSPLKSFAFAGVVYLMTGSLVQAFRPVTCRG